MMSFSKPAAIQIVTAIGHLLYQKYPHHLHPRRVHLLHLRHHHQRPPPRWKVLHEQLKQMKCRLNQPEMCLVTRQLSSCMPQLALEVEQVIGSFLSVQSNIFRLTWISTLRFRLVVEACHGD